MRLGVIRVNDHQSALDDVYHVPHVLLQKRLAIGCEVGQHIDFLHRLGDESLAVLIGCIAIAVLSLILVWAKRLLTLY